MKNKRKSIKFRLLVPLAAILLIESVLMMAFNLFGGISKTLRDNAVAILIEHTKNSRLTLEQEIVQRWIYSLRDTYDISNVIESVLESEHREPGDIASDGQLNRKILNEVSIHLIRRLYRSRGSGIYLILNGPDSEAESTGDLAGIRIWDSDEAADRQILDHLILKNGPKEIADTFEMILDRDWSPVFAEGSKDEEIYYQKPFIHEKTMSTDKIYGCLEYQMEEGPDGAITFSYSMPLVLSDETVVAVIGGEMTEKQLRKALLEDPVPSDPEILRFLAVKKNGTSDIWPVMTDMENYQWYFEPETSLNMAPTEWEELGKVCDREGEIWYAAAEPLQIFGSGNPYMQEEWIAVRMMRSDRLFAGANRVRGLFVTSMILSLLMNLLALMFAGSAITEPIQELLEELKRARRKQGSRLKPTQISELDELIDEINNLNGELEESALRISHILDASDVLIGVFEYNPDSGLVFCSRSLLKLLDLPYQEEWYVYLDKDDFTRRLLVLRNPKEETEGKIYEFESRAGLRYIRLKLMGDQQKHVTGVLADVTMEVKERRKLERERNYDLLTNLFNRRAFREKVEWLLRHQHSCVMAVVMWDLDNLKYVNDTYGHETGDRYIRLFADYLRTLELDGAIVERHAGDEFMAVMYNGSEDRLRVRLLDFMERLKEVRLKVPGGYELPLRASAGVVWYPRQAQEFDTLVRYADFAMYMSKHSYKGAVREFVPEIYQMNAYQLSGKEELSTFLETHLVEFALQPIIARDGSVYGYEALMRPHLKTLKNIRELLTLAKLQAKLPQIEELTWTGALEWISDRLPVLGEDCRFFINSIASASLTDDTLRMLENRYGSLLSRVVTEITETEQCDPVCLNRKVAAIRKWHGLLALDDYGAGYSGEGNLLKIRPDLVKMDLELVHDIHNDINRQTIVKNLISYCHQRGILVLAEGVERFEELECLMNLGVNLFQGFYLAHPQLEIEPLSQEMIEKMRKLSQK